MFSGLAMESEAKRAREKAQKARALLQRQRAQNRVKTSSLHVDRDTPMRQVPKTTLNSAFQRTDDPTCD